MFEIMPITLQETLEEIFTVLAYILLYSECADGFSRGDTMKVTAALYSEDNNAWWSSPVQYGGTAAASEGEWMGWVP